MIPEHPPRRPAAIAMLLLSSLWAGNAPVYAAAGGGLAEADRDSARTALEESAAAFAALVSGLDEEQLRFRPHAEAWSLADIAEHLAKVENVVRGTLADQVMGSPPRTQLLDEDGPPMRDRAIRLALTNRGERFRAPAALAPERTLSPEAAVEAFLASREETVAYVATTSDSLRTHFARHPLLGQLDGVQWLLFAAAHVERHTDQAIEVMAHPRFPESADAQRSPEDRARPSSER